MSCSPEERCRLGCLWYAWMQLVLHAGRAPEAWRDSALLIAGLAYCCKARAGQEQAGRAVGRGPHDAS